MLKVKSQLILLFSVLILVGCNTYPDSPEGVVKKYLNHLCTGECEEAQEMSYGSAISVLEATIESGCEPYILTIDSLDCEIRDTNCICAIYHDRDWNGTILEDLTMYFGLIKIDEKWKISDLSKDSGPWSWVDYYTHEFYENSVDDEFQKPIETIDLIFSNYIKYDKGIESADDREAITICLNQLDNKLSGEELSIILNVWMYYDPIDFPTKELTEKIFIKNKYNSKLVIEERIKNKLNWERENVGAYSQLDNLLEKINIERSKKKLDIKSEEVNTMIFFNDTEDTISIFYNGQCAYEYPIQKSNDSVYVYFDTLEDCVHRSGVKEYYMLPENECPKIGEVFLIMKVDSIRSYNQYLFPRWVDSVNSIYENNRILTSEFIVPND